MPQATYPEPVVLKPMKYINATPVHNVLLQQPLPHLIDKDCNESIVNISVLVHLQIAIRA